MLTLYFCCCLCFPSQLQSLARSIDYNPLAILLNSCLSETAVLNSLGDETHYLYALTPWTPTETIVDEFTGWTAQDFNDKYIETFNFPPTYHAASTFAAGEALIASFEICQSLNDTKAIAKALEESHFETFYANFSFTKGHQAIFKMQITQVCKSLSSF
jgi:ABC-type branched-subunit amino acid transport system substrate-binding protein